MIWERGSNALVELMTVAAVIVLMTLGVGIGIEGVVAQEEKDIIVRTAPGEDVTVQPGETVALGYPKGNTTRDYTWAYNWEVKNGDTSELLLHTGSRDAAGDVPAHNGRVTSFRAIEEDNYTVSLTVRDLDRSIINTVSRQITVSGSSGQVASYDKMKRYAPVLRFEEDELYRPTRIEAIFENAELRKGVSSSGEEIEVLDNANLYDVGKRTEGESDTDEFKFLLPIEVKETNTLVGGLWQGVFGVAQADAGTDGLVDPNLLTHLDDSDVYPQTVYAQAVGEVKFDPRKFNPRDELPESGEYYQELDRLGEVDLTADTYTAVGYWMMYVNDPKPKHVRGFDFDSWTTFGKAAGHTGDSSVVYVLFNKKGNPEWVLNQQHKGGEYRRWEHVEKEGGHPIIYVAQGAHTSFFGTGPTDERVDKKVRTPAEGGGTDLTGEKEKPEYVYQDQYFNTPGATEIFEDPIFDSKNIEGYVDIITYENDRYEWELGDDYEISVLTGNEAWSDYTGDYLTYPHSFEVGENPGATASKIPQNNLQFRDPGNWAEYRLFPDVAQIDGVFSDREATFTEIRGASLLGGPGDRMQQSVIRPDDDGILDKLPTDCVKVTKKCIEAPPSIVKENDRVTPDEADGSVGVNVINTGMQPHEFVLDLTTDSGDQADYSFYVNSIYPKNVAGAVVPLKPLGINEAGEYTVDADLSIYTDAYKLDDETFKLEIAEELPEPSLEIDEEETIDAGTINESRMVEIDVSVEGGDQLSGEYEWSVTVGGEEASFYDDGSPLTVYEGDGEYRVVFYAPEKDESGTYDVEVELETDEEELFDEKGDLLAYSEPGGVSQTVIALVLDKSGSMGTRDAGGTRMSAAKEAALGVIDRQSDSDYVSVVGFSSGSRVRQGLTKLDDGRASTESAVAGLGPGGFTNIGAGLSDGIDEVMKAPEGAQKSVILMSDGGRNRGPSKSAMRGMVRNRMNPNGICLQTNSLGDGADASFMNSLADTADCSKSTVSDSSDEIIGDFIDLERDIDDSELLKKIEDRIGGGETFEDTFGIDEEATSAILDVATGTAVSGTGIESKSTEGEIDVDDRVEVNDNRSDAELNVSGTSVESLRTGTLDRDRPAPEERNVRLYRPDGSIVDPVNSSDVAVSSTDDRTLYRIDDPEAGEWGYEIDGGETGTEFEARVTADSLTKLKAETSSDKYYTGTDAVLRATVFGSEPVTDANVEAEVEAPDGSSKTVTLNEVSPGIYEAAVELEEGVSGTYEATVRATKDEDNVEREATVDWDAEFAAPVSVGQPNVPVVEPGSEGETELTLESEALLGIRSVELGVSDFTHEKSNATIPGSRVSMNRSHLIKSGENVEVDAAVDVPSDTPTGTYTAEASTVVDNSGTTVDEVEIRVSGGGGTCVDRRDAGRGENEPCSGDRELERGYERAPERRDRGRGEDRGENGRRSRGR